MDKEMQKQQDEYREFMSGDQWTPEQQAAIEARESDKYQIVMMDQSNKAFLDKMNVKYVEEDTWTGSVLKVEITHNDSGE